MPHCNGTTPLKQQVHIKTADIYLLFQGRLDMYLKQQVNISRLDMYLLKNVILSSVWLDKVGLMC